MICIYGSKGNLQLSIGGFICSVVNVGHRLFRVKLGKPRSRFEELSKDVFFVAKVFALLKNEPQASEDRVWNYLLEGSGSHR